MTKSIYPVLFAAILVSSLSGCLHLNESNDTLFQSSTIGALFERVYDGDTTYKELKEHGDFGIGTFDGVDGEMVALDGNFYQIKADGKAYPVDDEMRTPFAVVKFFESDKTIPLEGSLDMRRTTAYIDGQLPTENIFYAVRIDGIFSSMKVRSVFRQQKPYPPFSEVVRNQSVFELHDVIGTIVGFRFPEYINGINVPGYHFHFISEDRKAGGHVLEFELRKGKAELDSTNKFYMVLPHREEFYRANLNRSKPSDVEKEKAE
jgi:acetolactate decarboxylase